MAKAEHREDEKLVAVRLSADELAAVEKAVRMGIVANSSEAIRLAVRYLPRAIADKFVHDDLPRLRAQLDALRGEMAASMSASTGRAGDAHVVEIQPEGAFVIAAASEQPLIATVKNARGRILPNAAVRWQVHPKSGGRIETEADSKDARFIGGKQPMLVTVRAFSGEARSPDVNVSVWPADGLRVGFRRIGEGFPTIAPPKARPVKRR